jgi:hypothetical protein
MLDFINCNEFSIEFKINEIYDLFKTESLEFNKDFLSNLEKYPNVIDFIEHYTKVDTHSINNLFNNILLTSFKIMNEDNNFNDIAEFELYSSGVSKIISLFYLIKKIKKIQSELIKNTKNYIKKFFINNKKESLIKEKIDFFINDLISSSKNVLKNASRRSTNEVSISSISLNLNNKNNFLNNISQEEGQQQKKESNSSVNKENFLALRTLTPKFDESQNIDQNNSKANINNSKDVKDQNNKKDTNKIDSCLTLQKMIFVDLEEKKEIINKNSVKKYPSHKVKSSNSQSHKKKARKFNSIGKCSGFSKRNSMVSNDDNKKRTILADLLDSINILYKDGKITSNQKISLKQIIISSPKIIIDRYYHDYSDVNNINIQNFIIEELKYL